MRLHALALGLLASAVSCVSATALTYMVDANEKACFYTWVESPPAKVAFYFAVSLKMDLPRRRSCSLSHGPIEGHRRKEEDD
jgi:hypothetical protein